MNTQHIIFQEAIIQCNKEIDLALKLEEMDHEQHKLEVESVLSRKLIAKGGKIEATPRKK